MSWRLVSPLRGFLFLFHLTGLSFLAFAAGPDFLWRIPAPSQGNKIRVSPDGQLICLQSPRQAFLFRSTGEFIESIPTVGSGGSSGPAFTADSSKILGLFGKATNRNYLAQLWLSDASAKETDFPTPNPSAGDLLLMSSDQKFLVRNSNLDIDEVDMTSGSILRTFNLNSPVAIVRNATGNRFGFFEGTIAKLYSYPGAVLLGTFQTGSVGKDVALTADGAYIVTCSNDGTRVWDTSTLELAAYVPTVGSLALTHDEQRLIVASTSQTCFVYRMPDLVLLSSFALPATPTGLGISPDDSTVYTAYGTGGTKLTAHSLATGQETVAFKYLNSTPDRIFWDPTGQSFSYPTGGNLKTFRVSDGALLRSVPWPGGTAFDYSPVTDLIASKLTGMTQVTRASDGAILFTFPTPVLHGTYDLAFSPAGDYLLVVGEHIRGDHSVPYEHRWIFQTSDWSTLVSLDGDPGYSTKCGFLPSGKYFIQYQTSSVFDVYEPIGGSFNPLYDVPDAPFQESEDGTTILTASGSTVSFRDATNGQVVRTVTVPTTLQAVSPDLTTIVGTTTGGADQNNIKVVLHSAVDGHTIAELDRKLGPAKRVWYTAGSSSLLYSSSTEFFSHFLVPGQNYALVNPDVLNVRYGRVIGGSLASLATADNVALEVQKFFVIGLNGPSVQFELEGVSPFLSPANIDVACSARINIAGSFQHTLELWNYQTSSWDSSARRVDPITSSYASYPLAPTGDLSRFIDPLTHRMKARLSLTKTGPASMLTWATNHDLFTWTVRN